MRPAIARMYTVGHSTHPLDTFAALLHRHDIHTLADVRRVPRSRRLPHFNADALARELADRGIAYRHLPRLGGWRKAAPDSPNGAWRNTSFRAYADFALTDEFGGALGELRELAAACRTAMMCSEGLWWQCHRRLIADRLVALGDAVEHIAPDGGLTAHELPPFAHVRDDGAVLYPGA